MIARSTTARIAATFLLAGLILAGVGAAMVKPAGAADLGIAPSVHASDGVPCDGPEAASFRGVWLGHFTGGYSQYTGPGGAILLDWRDEKLCFPSRRGCDRWIATLRRDFHRPEGNFTCLTIR